MNFLTNKKLNNGTSIPILGLGVFKSNQDTYNAVRYALDAGYRHIDTASYYNNEYDVGKAIKDSKINRKNIFITTKLWTDDMRNCTVKTAFEKSLKALNTDYIDLYLIHWPVKNEFINAYKIMEELYVEGRIKALGVSNFQPHHLEELLNTITIKPVINQIEVHPYLTNQHVIKFCKSLDIAPQSWSPLARARVLKDKTLQSLSNKYNKSIPQIVIRWHLQKDLLVIPKSVNKNRIIENTDVFDFNLSETELKLIDSLNKNFRTGSHPDTFNF